MRRIVFLAVVAAGLVPALAACSDTDRKAGFIDDATVVCEQSKHEIDVAFQAQLASQPTSDQVSFFLERTLAPFLRDRLSALRQLDLPDDDSRALRDLFDDYEAIVADIESDPDRFVAEADPFAQVDERFDDYGLPACGSAAPPANGE